MVGPESAGAHPGLSVVTDKSVVQADNFLKICLIRSRFFHLLAGAMFHLILHSHILYS